MVDRTIIIESLKSPISIARALEIINEYCFEKGFPREAIKSMNDFITNHNLLNSCLTKALEYYSSKFDIVYLLDSKGNIITVY